eukprot:750174-Hanusia_phi.AAC.3
MLERKQSGSSMGQAGSVPVPGERTMTFSELFAKLSRPEMLEGVRPAYTNSNPEALDRRQREKLVVILVGLPARGKSYISHRLVNYLNWYGIHCRLFNVGAYRRQKMAEDATKGSRADFFNKDNKDAAQKREELASEVLDQLLDWLINGGGNLAIFDATNTTRERRKRVIERCLKEKGIQCIFVESICNDSKVVEANLAEKVRLSPDFKGMDFHTAMKDLKTRIANYEAVYEELDESETDSTGKSMSFIKVINLSSKVIANNVHGGIARSVLTFLMNLHIVQRPIFLVRAPNSDGLEDQDVTFPGLQMPGGVLKDISRLDGKEATEGSEVDLRNTGKYDSQGEPVRRRTSHTDLYGRYQSSELNNQPIIQFEDERSAVLELAGEVNVVVVRRGDTTMPCSVHFQTVDGTAKAGIHYVHNSGVLNFASMQSRAEIKVMIMDCQNCHAPDENFSIVLSGIQPAGAILGRKQQCTVTILNDDAGLPERLRMDWSRLRFPDSSKLTRALNDGGREVADRLGVLLEEQVQEFYMRQHKQKLEKVKVVRDLCQGKLMEIREDINSTIHRRGVVEAAMQIQHRLDGEVVHS